jgi:predicted TIM-barrel fold metal-dependent hydrolase
MTPTRKIDMHSHWGTKRGYPMQTPEDVKLQKSTWNSEPAYKTEQEMADYLRSQKVSAVLDLGFPRFLPVEQMREYHDYAFGVEKAHADVILGQWLHFDPRVGQEGVRELRRCADAAPGFLGLCIAGAGTVSASDPSYVPYLKLCIEAKLPVLICVGTTAYGSGAPGGAGVLLDDSHPRHLDFVAARYPDLTILAGRPGWPWQADTNAILMHKRNVWYELHGWSPKYHDPALKYEITRRLKDRVMFGADYPMITYERLESDWRAEGYSEETLEKVFSRNAEAFFQSIGRPLKAR